MDSQKIIPDEITNRLCTEQALLAIGLARSQFYALAKAANVEPLLYGRVAFWAPDDLKKIARQRLGKSRKTSANQPAIRTQTKISRADFHAKAQEIAIFAQELMKAAVNMPDDEGCF